MAPSGDETMRPTTRPRSRLRPTVPPTGPFDFRGPSPGRLPATRQSVRLRGPAAASGPRFPQQARSTFHGPSPWRLPATRQSVRLRGPAAASGPRFPQQARSTFAARTVRANRRSKSVATREVFSRPRQICRHTSRARGSPTDLPHPSFRSLFLRRLTPFHDVSRCTGSKFAASDWSGICWNSQGSFSGGAPQGTFHVETGTERFPCACHFARRSGRLQHVQGIPSAARSVPKEGLVVTEYVTLGGDPEVARMMGEDIRFHSEIRPVADLSS